MTRLSRHTINAIHARVEKPGAALFGLPEKILQFGTGVLLRGLCDWAIHDANTKGRFNGTVVVVKSTSSGGTDAFEEQDNLYTVCIRGLDNGKVVTNNIICSAISRVLNANYQWDDVLKTVHDPQLEIIISNTTEVGLQLVKEKITSVVPASFPGKLLAVLLERYRHCPDAGMIVIPTELISGNGDKLRSIISDLASFSSLGSDFIAWVNKKITFCNSLVDRIVTKDPGEEMLNELQEDLGYRDELLTMCEDYRLWAIEGNTNVKKTLSFATGDNGTFVEEDINIYKFLKLHLLNGTHTLSASLAYLAGFDYVKDGMNDNVFSAFVANLMQKDIASAIPYEMEQRQITAFSEKVLDRFRNPFLKHKWINITLQNTMKMRNRNIPVLLRYQELFGSAPKWMSTGFAGFLLFMKAVKKEGRSYYGMRNNEYYEINDDQAGYFYDLWNRELPVGAIVKAILSNSDLWGTNISAFTAFEESVIQKLSSMITKGVTKTIADI